MPIYFVLHGCCDSLPRNYVIRRTVLISQANVNDFHVLEHVASDYATCVVGSKSFRPDQRFKVTEIKQLCYFSTQSPFISTHFSTDTFTSLQMALYIPHSFFHLARLLYVRPETFGPYYVCEHPKYLHDQPHLCRFTVSVLVFILLSTVQCSNMKHLIIVLRKYTVNKGHIMVSEQ